MDLVRFERELPGLYDNLRESLHPKNRKLKNLCREVDGMSTENKLMTLNFAASLLGPNEVYLEIGSWKGLSIIGAMMGNYDQHFYAIDDFSQFQGPKREFQSNLQRYGFSEKLNFIEGDCFEIFRTRFLGSQKVGVYFYDGDHSYDSQYYAIRAIEPFLANNALLIIDDCSFPQVRAANTLFCRLDPNIRLLFDIASDYNGEPKWWNGVQILSYRRDRRAKHNFTLALLQLAFEIGRIKFEFLPYVREYRRHSILLSSFPNVLGNTIAYALYCAVGKEQKALKAKERILKHWRYLTGKAYRPPRGRYTS
jgi:predicted O-methyltransferase YrrM